MAGLIDKYVGFYESCKKALRTSQFVELFYKFIVIIVNSQNI